MPLSQREPVELTLASVLTATWKHKLLFSSAVLFTAGFAVLTYIMVTPAFQASTTLLIGQSDADRSPEASRKTAENASSLAQIAGSLEVIRDAINRVGLERLRGEELRAGSASLGALRTLVLGAQDGERARIPEIDVVAEQLSKRVIVRVEPNSDVLRISFRHRDPSLAASFTNTLAQAFIDRQIQLLERPGAVAFFQDQKSRFEAEVERRSAALEAFVRREDTYSVDDQRSLLLKRASDLAAALTGTRSSLSEKEGQRTALVSQLRMLKPVTQSRFVSGVVNSLSGDERGSTAQSSRQSAGTELSSEASEPPLLMVKVYQDAMVALFRVNAEISGLRQLDAKQQAELARTNAELGSLAARQTEFERLKRDVSLATYNAELYAKRMVEEQIIRDLKTAKFSNMRVIQPATIPMRPVFPNGLAFLAVGIGLGAVGGAAAAFLMEVLYLRRTNSVKRSSGFPDSELRFGDLSVLSSLVATNGRASERAREHSAERTP